MPSPDLSERNQKLRESKKQSDNVTGILQRGPVFNLKSRSKNVRSYFHLLPNPSSNQVRILKCPAFLKYVIVIMERKRDSKELFIAMR